MGRAEAAAKAGLADVCALVARRLRRDHERISQYFEQLARDARAPRREVEPAAIAARLAHLEAERDAKLRALAERYRLRVKLEPLALLQLRVPTSCVRLGVRRRKLYGGDRGTTAQPVLCDDRLHVLCEGCAPLAQGRPSCAACRGPG